MQGDPYKTLFVSRLSYEVTERKLRHEFEEFGPIRRIRLVHDQDKGESGEGTGAQALSSPPTQRCVSRHTQQPGLTYAFTTSSS
jgi:RNA recognition motif-containing protein